MSLPELYLDAELVSPTGGLTSNGLMNQLGRPSMEPLAVLVREAVQNSWDARQDEHTSVRFTVHGWQFSDTQKQVLTKFVFADLPNDSSLPIKRILSENIELYGLLITDRGTKGLGGPTRADKVDDDDNAKDFVDFLRNVGQPPDKRFSGGTYGYGKSAFYRASHAHAILVHTRCRFKGKLESRFIISALGHPHEERRKKYTGRYWWGQKKDEIAEPLLNKQADQMAVVLGFPPFNDDECGTSILILQPRFDTSEDEDSARSPRQALNSMAENLLWYFWPKMLAYGKKRQAMIFEVQWENEMVKIPNPADYAPLRGFVYAMKRLKDPQADSDGFPSEMYEIKSQRPAQGFGKLALQLYPLSTDNQFDTGSTVNDENIFSSLTHHIALLRQPELVVKYLHAPEPLIGNLALAGVFITDPEVDSIFAEAEPPAHDDWVPDSLEDNRHKRYVKLALKNIKENAETFVRPKSQNAETGEMASLGVFASRLGNSLIPIIPGPEPRAGGASLFTAKNAGTSDEHGNPPPPPPPPKKKSSSSNRPPTPKGQPQVIITESRPLTSGNLRRLEVSFKIIAAPKSTSSLVTAKPRVLLDDGGVVETEPPLGTEQPKILRWLGPRKEEYGSSNKLSVNADDEGIWRVIISMPGDVYLKVDLTAEAE